MIVEAKKAIQISFEYPVANKLSEINNDNKGYEKSVFGKVDNKYGYAKNAFSHIRKKIIDCKKRCDEIPFAYLRNEKHNPVFAFLISNQTNTKQYYLIAVLDDNNLICKNLFGASESWDKYVLTNQCFGALNAVANPDHQLFVDNPSLIEYINSNADDKNETMCLHLKQLYQDYETLYKNSNNSILEYLITNRY